jgi:magnesium-transporting ATPase (P-type)
VHEIADKLNTHMEKGICTDDLKEREEFYGSNMREPPKRTPFCKLFFGALEDFMLRMLLVCAVISITFEMAFAEHDLNTGTLLLISFYNN